MLPAKRPKTVQPGSFYCSALRFLGQTNHDETEFSTSSEDKASAATGNSDGLQHRAEKRTCLNKGTSEVQRKRALAWQARLQQLRQGAEHAAKLRVVMPRPEDLRYIHRIWRTFPRQDMAFEFADSVSVPTMVFAYEDDSLDAGKRRYLVATRDWFWCEYYRMEPNQRHYYEVIRVHSPCHLYFDLEFKHQYNPDRDTAAMMTAFIALLRQEIKAAFGIKLEREHILDLDSSTDTKFSRHLIVRMPNAAFRNNLHAGIFVRDLETKILTASESDDWACLRVDEGSGNTTTIVDSGVYSRNRNFRLYLSSKRGKQVPLTLASGNAFPINSTLPEPQRQRLIFEASIVTNVDCNVRLLSCAGADTASSQPPDASAATVMQGASPEQHGYQSSPYPEIDMFVARFCQHHGSQGKGRIRRWAFFDQRKVIIYDIAENRYCELIRRPHKSNGIMLVVNLEQGVIYQKCHDPDCRRVDFRGQEHPLPIELMPFKPHWMEDSSTGPRSVTDEDEEAIDRELTALFDGDEGLEILELMCDAHNLASCGSEDEHDT